MNEPFNAIGVDKPPRAERKAALDSLVKAVLGPNEDLAMPLFTPYTPVFNLLPRPKPPSWFVLGGVALALSVVVLGSVAAGLTFMTQRAANEIQEVQRQTTVRKLAEQRYQALQRQVNAVDAQKGAFEFVAQSSPHWSEILDRMRGLMPEGVRVDRIEGAPDGTLFLKGKAETLKDVGNFMLNLRGSGVFYEPRLGMGDRLVERGQTLVAFDLQVKVAHGDWLANPEFTNASRSTSASGSMKP